MYTYLLQKIDGEFQFDFVMETFNAINFANWYAGETVAKYITCESINDVEVDNPDYTIPVGSVEFCLEYYNKYLNLEIKPINIPEELFELSKRKIYKGNEKTEISNKTFAKSYDSIKGYVSIIQNNKNLPVGNYLFSEVIEDIDSEWRVFVMNNEIISIHNYVNSLGEYPDIEYLKKIVEKYSGKLGSYSFDVGVNKELGTFLIEIHDFFATGFYGFRDYKKILIMTIMSHSRKVKNKKRP